MFRGGASWRRRRLFAFPPVKTRCRLLVMLAPAMWRCFPGTPRASSAESRSPHAAIQGLWRLCSCPGSALPALLASRCRVMVTPRKHWVKLEGAKTQTQCALWQASRANISLLAAPRSIKHPGGCFQAPRLGAGSPHPSWSQAGVPGCELGWWGAARWRWGAHLQGAGLLLAAEAAWDEGGGHAGQTLGGSIHASKELTATAARGSRLHRQPPSIPNAHFMPTHPEHQLLQEISRNKEEQTGRCQSRAKPGEDFWYCL